MASTATATRREVPLAGLPIPVLEGGDGSMPVVVLPHDTGNPGWLDFHERLAQQHRVIAPTLPGFDGVQRPDWMTSARDMAVLLQTLLDRLELSEIALVGLGFGGWLAVEMATMDQRRYSRLVLVGAMGLQPEEGAIADQFLEAHEDFVKRGFHDSAAYEGLYGAEASVDQLVQWDVNREMTARIAWRPYMFNPALPALLPELRVPALLVWGAEDAIVPRSCGDQYLAALPDARLELIQAAGHYLEVEQPAALAETIAAFLDR